MAISAGDPEIQQKEKKNEIKFAFIHTCLAYVCNQTLIGIFEGSIGAFDDNKNNENKIKIEIWFEI